MKEKDKDVRRKPGRKPIDRELSQNYHIWLNREQTDFIAKFREQNPFLRTKSAVICYAVETLRKATEHRV